MLLPQRVIWFGNVCPDRRRITGPIAGNPGSQPLDFVEAHLVGTSHVDLGGEGGAVIAAVSSWPPFFR